MKLSTKIFLIILFFSCFSIISLNLYSIRSQEKYQELRHEVAVTLKLVQVYVTDNKGNPVVNLKKEDFNIKDNGKKMVITEFEKHIISLPFVRPEVQPEIIQETSLPLPRELLSRKFFLLFDFAYNNAKGITKAKKAALHFINTKLQPSDEVGVLSYSSIKGLKLHEYLTSDHAKIKKVVKEIGLKEIAGRAENFEEQYWRQATGENPLDASKRGGVFQEHEELDIVKPSEVSPEVEKFFAQQDSNLYAFYFVKKMKDFAKALRYIPGYKNIIFFSSGIPYSLMYGIHQSIDSSRRSMLKQRWDLGNRLLQDKHEEMLKELAASNSAVFTLDTENMGATIAVNSRLKGGFTLQTMASSTGGKYFGNINSYEKHLEKIQNLTGCYYVLGYYIDEKWDGKYHKIIVKVNRSGCEVHAQKGYFNPKPFSEYSKLEKKLHLVDLALSERPLFQTPIRFPLVTLSFSGKGKSNLELFSKIPMQKIQELSGRNVEIVSIIFDKENNVVKIERDAKDFSRLPKGNTYYSNSLSLDPGDYKCRLVIRNLDTGRGAVASSMVKVPSGPDSAAIQLYPPLLLKPEEDAFYLKKPSDAYAFDLSQYSPLVEELPQGTNRVLAEVRCTFSGIQQPDIQLFANFIRHSADTGRTVPVTTSILSRYQDDSTEIFLIELQTEKLQSGEYFLYLFAKDKLTLLRSQVNTTFKVK